MFDCRYDLKAINLKPEEIQGMVQAGLNSAMGMGGAQGGAGAGTGAGTEGTKDKAVADAAKAAAAQAAPVFDPAKIAALAWLLSPQGELTRTICRIDPAWIGIGVMGLSTYMPQIIDQLGKRTRQLNVRMAWKEGPRKERELKVQTFIVSLPEEEVAAAREMDRQREDQKAVQDAIKSNVPPQPPPQRK
jgi:hypothetical protein